MPIITLADLPSGGVILAVDPGRRRIGVAASDVGQRLAVPVGTLRRNGAATPLLQELLQLYDDRDGVGMIIGLPLNMDGSSGPAAQSARGFAANVLERRDLPICFQDERLSSAAAARSLSACGFSRAERSRRIDAASAGLVLQAALDRRGSALP